MNFKEFYYDNIKKIEQILDSMTDRGFVRDENSLVNGEYVTFDMLPDEAGEVGRIAIITYAYCCKDNKYYKNRYLLDKLEEAIISLRKKFNDDGTMTMYQSNFHTADQFGLFSLAKNLRIFKNNLFNDEREKEVFEKFAELVEYAATGCLNGGFHTPNHRWVETTGLLIAYETLKDIGKTTYTDALFKKAKMYLAEGVDCDEYGEWSERSTGVYNPPCDNSFLNIYRIIKDEEYYDCVYRNLMLVRHYINDDYTLYTQNSRRKDKGEVGSVQFFYKAKTYYADSYIQLYIHAAYLKKDSYLASIAYNLIQKGKQLGKPNGVYMDFFLDYPDLIDWEFEYKEDNLIPNTYEHYLPKSNIVRKKENGITYSYLANNPCFFQIDAPGINMKMRLCSSFFAIAQYVPEKMEKTDDGYKMTMKAFADYKLPLENPDGTTTKDYWSIDYQKRGSIQAQTFVMTTSLKFSDDDVALTISLSGCDKVPSKIEMFFNEGLHLEIGDACTITSAGGNIYSKGKDVRIESEQGTIMEISDLFCKHLYTSNMRGSLDPINGAFALYATDFSPVERTIHFKLSKSKNRRIFY